MVRGEEKKAPESFPRLSWGLFRAQKPREDTALLICALLRWMQTFKDIVLGDHHSLQPRNVGQTVCLCAHAPPPQKKNKKIKKYKCDYEYEPFQHETTKRSQTYEINK